MRALFIILILFHGLIHLMGFVKAFQIAEMPQLQATFSKPMGVLWLITAILFLVAFVLLFVSNYWFIPATAAVFFSTALIILAWSDARFGMIPNIIILIVCFFAITSYCYKAVYLNDIRSNKKQF